MDADELIAEGRKLIRPSVYLEAEGDGPIAAYLHEFKGIPDEWEEEDDEEGEPWYFLRITIDSRFIPGWEDQPQRFVQVWFDAKEWSEGKVTMTETAPTNYTTALHARSVDSFPPIEAVFLFGSEKVKEWTKSNEWDQEWGYNDYFPPKHSGNPYIEIYIREDPLFHKSPPYAVLGGWHHQWPDDAFQDLIDDELLVTTYRESEPWVEAWKLRSGGYRVNQRIT